MPTMITVKVSNYSNDKKMKTKFNNSEDKGRQLLTVVGDLTVHAGDQFKKHLQLLFEQSADGILSLKEVKSMDVSSVQLIKSFTTLADVNKTKIQIILPEDPDLLDLLERTDLLGILEVNNRQ